MSEGSSEQVGFECWRQTEGPKEAGSGMQHANLPVWWIGAGPSWIVFRLGAAGWFVGTCSSPHVTPSICPLPSEKTCGQRGRHQQVWSSTQCSVAIATSFPHNPLPPHQMFILATWSKPSDPVWPRGTLPPSPVQLVQPQPGQQRGGQAQSFGSRRSCRPAFSYHFPSFPRLPHWVVWGWGVRSCDFRNLERTGSYKKLLSWLEEEQNRKSRSFFFFKMINLKCNKCFWLHIRHIWTKNLSLKKKSEDIIQNVVKWQKI